MRRFFRWLRRNMGHRQPSQSELRRQSIEEVYLHDQWLEHFHEDLERWKESRR